MLIIAGADGRRIQDVFKSAAVNQRAIDVKYHAGSWHEC
jgi:hypothetical protein